MPIQCASYRICVQFLKDAFCTCHVIEDFTISISFTFHTAVLNLRKLISEIHTLNVEIHSSEILKNLSNKK